jgi:hypothetical protein
VFGTVGIAAAFVSAWVGWQITDATQRAADERIKAADLRIAEATVRAAEANQKAEEERLARVKIEARIAPRRLTQDQQHELTKRLANFEKPHVVLTVSPSTPESEWFVRILGAPLKEAGWQLEMLPGTAEATILQPTGVVIQVGISPDVRWLPGQSPTASFAAANALAKALNDFGIAATAIPGVDVAPGRIKIVVTPR